MRDVACAEQIPNVGTLRTLPLLPVVLVVALPLGRELLMDMPAFTTILMACMCTTANLSR